MRLRSTARLLILMMAVALATAGCGTPSTTGSIRGYVVKFAGARGASGATVDALAVVPTPTDGFAPVAEAYVQYDGPSGHGFTMTGSDGAFFIPNLIPGSYTINISHPRFVDNYTATGLVVAGRTWNVGTRRLGSVRILCIGINDYQYINDLSGAVPDAEMLYEVLSTNNLLVSEAWILKDSQASESGILGAIQSIAEGMGPDDTFIMTYAGHGTYTATNEYILPYDYSASYPSRAISDVELNQWLNTYVAAGTSVFVFDSCFSGGMAEAADFLSRGEKRSTGFDTMARNIAAPNRVVMTATTKSQESFEFTGLPVPGGRFETHGIFAYGFAKGMWNPNYFADNNRDNNITCAEAFAYADAEVARQLAEPLGPMPGDQTPRMYDLGAIASSTYIFSY